MRISLIVIQIAHELLKPIKLISASYNSIFSGSCLCCGQLKNSYTTKTCKQKNPVNNEVYGI